MSCHGAAVLWGRVVSCWQPTTPFPPRQGGFVSPGMLRGHLGLQAALQNGFPALIPGKKETKKGLNQLHKSLIYAAS